MIQLHTWSVSVVVVLPILLQWTSQLVIFDHKKNGTAIIMLKVVFFNSRLINFDCHLFSLCTDVSFLERESNWSVLVTVSKGTTMKVQLLVLSEKKYSHWWTGELHLQTSLHSYQLCKQKCTMRWFSHFVWCSLFVLHPVLTKTTISEMTTHCIKMFCYSADCSSHLSELCTAEGWTCGRGRAVLGAPAECCTTPSTICWRRWQLRRGIALSIVLLSWHISWDDRSLREWPVTQFTWCKQRESSLWLDDGGQVTWVGPFGKAHCCWANWLKSKSTSAHFSLRICACGL